jgi:hypothetical protein
MHQQKDKPYKPDQTDIIFHELYRKYINDQEK